MSSDAKARKLYEKRVVDDALARLAKQFDSECLPFSEDELRTLAKRCRESFGNPERRRERLDRYKAHLARTYEADLVASISSALEAINNAIGYEEK